MKKLESGNDDEGMELETDDQNDKIDDGDKDEEYYDEDYYDYEYVVNGTLGAEDTKDEAKNAADQLLIHLNSTNSTK